MDVRLPNGAVIQNVPEGTTREEVAQRAIQAGLASREDFGMGAPQPSIEDRRRDVGTGQTLRAQIPFTDIGVDTGIEMPQWLTEGLAGAGRRMTRVRSFGTDGYEPVSDELLDNSTAATVGAAATDIAAMSLGGAALKSMGMASEIPAVGKSLMWLGKALQAPQSLSQAALAGAAYGALTENDRGAAALAGTLGGAVGYGLTRGVASIIKPRIADEADELLRRGVKLTPGEMFGQTMKSIEEGATSTPFAGDMIKAAKRQSIEDFNRSIANSVLEELDGPLLGWRIPREVSPGREMVETLDDFVSEAYRRVLPNMKATADMKFYRDIGELKRMTLWAVDKKTRDDYDFVLRNYVLRSFKGENRLALGETLKELDSKLGLLIRGFKNTEDPYKRQLGFAYRETQKALRHLMERQNPQWAPELRKADAAFAKLHVIREAAARSGSKEGVFTPNQLLAAIKSSSSKRQYARGSGLMQGYTERANRLLSKDVPDSGTPFRGALTAAAVGGATGAVSPTAALGLGAGTWALRQLYKPTAQDVIRSLLTRQDPLALAAGGALHKLAPTAGMMGIAAGINNQ